VNIPLVILSLVKTGDSVYEFTDFKQNPANITGPSINIKKRRHGEEEMYYIPVSVEPCNFMSNNKCLKLLFHYICSFITFLNLIRLLIIFIRMIQLCIPIKSGS